LFLGRLRTDDHSLAGEGGLIRLQEMWRCSATSRFALQQ
jgi:hypothetical protein